MASSPPYEGVHHTQRHRPNLASFAASLALLLILRGFQLKRLQALIYRLTKGENEEVTASEHIGGYFITVSESSIGDPRCP